MSWNKTVLYLVALFTLRLIRSEELARGVNEINGCPGRGTCLKVEPSAGWHVEIIDVYGRLRTSGGPQPHYSIQELSKSAGAEVLINGGSSAGLTAPLPSAIPMVREPSARRWNRR